MVRGYPLGQRPRDLDLFVQEKGKLWEPKQGLLVPTRRSSGRQSQAAESSMRQKEKRQ